MRVVSNRGVIYRSQAEEKAKRETVALTLRLSRHQWQRVHQSVQSKGVSLNQLVLHGLSKVLEEEGLVGL